MGLIRSTGRSDDGCESAASRSALAKAPGGGGGSDFSANSKIMNAGPTDVGEQAVSSGRLLEGRADILFPKPGGDEMAQGDAPDVVAELTASAEGPKLVAAFQRIPEREGSTPARRAGSKDC